jgi:tetratricopeptide (TPR) repeat protein
MRGQFFKFLSFLLCLSFVIVVLYPGAASAERCEQWVAKVVSVQGTVDVKKVGEARWQPVELNDTYCPGDEIRAQENSRANLALINEAVLRLNQNTSMTLGEFKEEQTSLVDLFKGAAHFFSRKPRSLEVQTPFAIAGVRGTEFFIEVQEGQTFLSIFQGEVLAQNKFGQLTLTSGQSAVAERGKAPAMRVVVRPRDAVQWALYYPPVLYFPEGVREDRSDPRFLAYNASQLLAVGRVDEADANIERALRLDPNNSDALALQAIIAVVQNDRDKALSAAQQAVQADPNSATALIALSYAKQARFDLEGARASLEKAVQVDPENALAWARLAELQASFGYLTQSVESAEKAVALDPNVSRTQTVLGFANLTKVRTQQAKEAFEKAIQLDQADPLPRLGLGLAKIRGSDLEEGRAEIEIAASLDPNNSLIGSYLGKAYYEEKRTNLDGPEYEIAKELDPKDPTPHFYDAIRKQTINRPVEALRDFEKSIELNDNRAVYRSKQKLDSDEAARQASLARIYSNLGFQQLALVEGWKSVNTDPTNNSAHRFLADSYAARPRHEVARVSELLQSQLLQPNNITPIQPRLAESNLFLISGQGPGGLSFNEFNPIFNRDRIAVQGSGLVGSNNTLAGEVVASGIYNKLSFSGGYTYFDTDGWRENADQREKIANVFAQYELTYKTSIQAEYRYRDSNTGDTQLRFFEDDFRPDRSVDTNFKTARLGGRHAFSPGSILIGNFAYQKVKDDEFDLGFIDPLLLGLPLPQPDVEDFINVDTDAEAYSGELSYLFRSNTLNLVGGAGYFRIEQDTKTTQDLFWPIVAPPVFLGQIPDRLKQDIDHYNVYLYSYLNFLENVTFTAGASGDFYDANDKKGGEQDIDKNEFNPKFGITWNPFPDTTLRGAVFRTFKRTLVTDQTLEPTQVAGFNQFFDEPNTTEAWVYGAAVDQKFFKSVYGGAEFNYRDLSVPYFESFGGGQFDLRDTSWDEYYVRTYLYWTPHDLFALRAEYQYEEFDRGDDFNLNIKESKTHIVPLGVNFFHPSGLSAGLKATYYDQKGKFERELLVAPPPEKGSDDFWLVDAAINLRFPKRYGFFTLGVTNLFDEEFEYADTDINNPRIQPDRFYFASITLALP